LLGTDFSSAEFRPRVSNQSNPDRMAGDYPIWWFDEASVADQGTGQVGEGLEVFGFAVVTD